MGGGYRKAVCNGTPFMVEKIFPQDFTRLHV